MAAIVHKGNTIVIGAAGTIDIPQLEIISMRVVTTASAALLRIVELGSGGVMPPVLFFEVAGFRIGSYNVNAEGSYGRLSVDTVTTCSAWITKR